MLYNTRKMQLYAILVSTLSVHLILAQTTSAQGCDVNGSHYDYGDDVPSDDICSTNCTCVEDQGVMCENITCELLRCIDPIRNDSECCPICPNGPNCIFGRKIIPEGETFTRNRFECSCPDPWEPAACCKKIPRTAFFKRLERKWGSFLDPKILELADAE